MKVMMLTPRYWISGTVTHARELQSGWPSEWPRPPIVVPTASGKPSTLWCQDVNAIKRATATSWCPDRWGSPQEVLELARSFDLVHVTEVDMPRPQRDWWLKLLLNLDVPWTIQLNGNQYLEVDWDVILSSRRFTRVIWKTPGLLPEPLMRDDVRIIELPRPWNLRNQIDAPRVDSSSNWVGTHARIAANKGIATVMALMHHAKVNVCVHGAPQAGAYPYSLVLQGAFLHDACYPAEHTWGMDNGSNMLQYLGAFADGVTVAQHHAVHVSATRLGFSAGTEFSLLEAIDAGCRIVQPRHMLETPDFLQWPYDWETRGAIGAIREPIPSLNRAVHDALLATDYNPSINRRVVSEYHNPARITRAFFGEVGMHA